MYLEGFALADGCAPPRTPAREGRRGEPSTQPEFRADHEQVRIAGADTACVQSPQALYFPRDFGAPGAWRKQLGSDRPQAVTGPHAVKVLARQVSP